MYVYAHSLGFVISATLHGTTGIWDNARVGTWQVLDTDIDRTPVCDTSNAKNIALTHTNPTPRAYITLVWTPPSVIGTGTIDFHATIMQDINTFYMLTVSLPEDTTVLQQPPDPPS